MWVETRYLRWRACDARPSGAGSQLQRIFRMLAAAVAELTHLSEAEEVGDNGFATAVLVGAIRVQSVAAAAGFRVDQRQGQIVVAEEPRERPLCVGLPRDVTADSPGGEACGDRCGGFQGLLVEGQRARAPGSEASRADGSEEPCRCCLQAHEPVQGS